MPATLRCEETFSVGCDPTGENARECGAPALACTDCGESAGCSLHAELCPKFRQHAASDWVDTRARPHNRRIRVRYMQRINEER